MAQRTENKIHSQLRVIVFSMIFALLYCAQTSCTQTTFGQSAKQPLIQIETGKTTSSPSDTVPPQKKKSSAEKKEEKSTSKSDIIYLIAPDGNLVPVPANASLKEYLESKKKQSRKIKKNKLRYSIASVSLTGSVAQGGTHAELKANISIQLDVADEWVRVAFKMHEAVLKESQYSGKGTASFDQFDRTAGYSWWLKGKGTHTLNLSLLVPIRKKAPMRRLQLSLPETAVSHLKLTVPIPEINVKENEQSFTRITNPNTKTSLIDMFGLGTLLDLQWQALPSQKQKKTVLHTATRIHVVPHTESVLMTATQEIRAFQGSFSSLKVQLPKEWELVDLKGDEYVSHTFINQQTVLVQLDEKTAGPIELVWTLEAPFPKNLKPLSLQGFQVEKARRQTGSIAIEKLDGYQIAQIQGKSVHRMNVSSIVDSNRVATAYHFLKQPYQLQITIQEIDPNYTVHPEYQLQISQDEIELDATYKILVHRGAVKSIQFLWSSRLTEGWSLETISSEGLISSNLIDKTSNPQRITVPLIERKNGEFEIRLRARKKTVPGEKSTLLQFPLLIASEQRPAKLTIKQADNLEVQFIPDNKTRLKKLKKNKESISYQLTNSARETELSLLATIQAHPQKLITKTTEILKLKNNKLLVKQHIAYEVTYERLSQVRFQVPDEILGRVQFFFNGDVPLTENTTGLMVEGGHQTRIPLPEPQLGKFEIVASYTINLPSHSSTEKSIPILLPLISSSDAPYKEVRLRSELSPLFQLLLEDSSFQSELKSNETTEWVSYLPQNRITVQLKPREQFENHQLKILRGRVQTAFEQTGQERTRAQYLLEGNSKFVTFEIHSESLIEWCWWNDKKVAPVSLGNNRYRLSLKKHVAKEPYLLTIDYHSKLKSRSRWTHSYQLPTPKILGGNWVGGVVWDVTIPADQHLFLLPQNFSPLFQWEREGIFWRRRLPKGISSQMSLPKNIVAPAIRTDVAHGNHYLFSRLGAPETMKITAMNRSLVVLFGAGLSLIAGFVLLKIPATRNLLTLLFVAFVVSVVALWYWEPVQLLIQPALLGLLLAVSAAMIERMLEQKRFGSNLTLPIPSEYVIPSGTGSSVEHPHPLFGVGSEDPTMVRPAEESPSASSSEVGSHS